MPYKIVEHNVNRECLDNFDNGGMQVPYVRVDQETKTLIRRFQAFFRLAEGKDLTEGGAIKEVFKEAAFEITGPTGQMEIIRYPFDQFEVRHISPEDLAKEERRGGKNKKSKASS